MLQMGPCSYFRRTLTCVFLRLRVCAGMRAMAFDFLSAWIRRQLFIERNELRRQAVIAFADAKKLENTLSTPVVSLNYFSG